MVKKGRPRKMKSKRVLAKTRYKVERKVKEHRRKQRKEERKKGNRERPKKDIGIPNLAPFKETILREAQDRKAKQQEIKLKQKDQRFDVVMKQRKLGDLKKSAELRAEDFELKQDVKKSKKTLADHVTGDSETSRKTYYKEFKKVLDASDVVIQVLDARDPLGSRCPQLEQAVLATGINKKLVLLLNKIDLVPSKNVEKWLKHLRNEFPTIAFKASTQLQRQNLSQSTVPVRLTTKDLMQSSRCLGADHLMKLLNNYCRNADIKTAITVGIVGFPNVGKSSVINSLKRSKACNVGAQPGVTKAKQEVHLAKNIKLLDSPGVVMATSNSEVAMVLRNCIKIESLQDPISSVEAILKRCNKEQIMLHYNITDFRDVHEFLAMMAKRQGKLKKKGIPDTNQAAKRMLMDWNSGRISFYTHPPEQHTLPAHIDAKIVAQMSEQFDMKSLEEQDQQVLGVLPPVRPSCSVLVESCGLTMGVADEDMIDSDENEDMLEDEEWEDIGDQEEIEDDKDELKDVTVELSNKTTSDTSATSKRSTVNVKSKGPLKKVVTKKESPGNEQQNRSKKKEFKQMLKKRKRADKLATTLSDELTQAMDFDEEYDFNSDFV